MTTKFAFIGFRHPHLFDMFRRCREREDIEIVACCEQDEETRASLVHDGDIEITHGDPTRLLTEIDCDVVAVGDCYGRRAHILIDAMESGKHVISDKPICICREEFEQIESTAIAKHRVVGCMLDMRDLPVMLGIQQLIRSGEIGDIQAIHFDGQHPLLYGKRPMWYFEPGMHGGVFGDIVIHAVDFIPWATGQAIKSVTAARAWNATVPQHPQFQQCGQALFTLDNNAGVTCDVSYLTPNSFAYDLPQYWRYTLWGDGGVLEAGLNSDGITLYKNGEQTARMLNLPAAQPGGYLDSFLREIEGVSQAQDLTSSDIFSATRAALAIQEAADSSAT